MIKKLFTVFVLAFLYSFSQAQANDQRLLSTRIADLLAQMPSIDSAHYAASMHEIYKAGEPGILQMAGMLAAPGDGDNAKLEFAINGFSYYVTQPGKEGWRRMAEKAYCKALPQISNKVNQAFIISQLQIVAQTDETVTTLSRYLNDDDLCDPVSRALIKLNSKAGNDAMFNAVKNAKGTCRLSLIKALGHIRYTAAIPVITSLTRDNDVTLQKVSLNALANIGSLSSAIVLKTAAQKSNYVFDKTNATDTYIIYLQNLLKDGKVAQVKQYAQSLNTSLKKPEQLVTRTAAMTMLSQIEGNKNISVLLKALDDNNFEYRIAALKLAGKKLASTGSTTWIQKLKSASPVVQSEIITMLGNNKVKAALPAMIAALKNTNKVVRLAAISAAVKTGNEEVLPALLAVMKNGNNDDVEAVQSAIGIMKGNGVMDKVANALASSPSNAKVALVQVLGNRGAHDKVDFIFPLLQSKDTSLRKAAFVSIQDMAGEKDLDKLFSILSNTTDANEISSLQNAIVNSVKRIELPSKRSVKIISEMNKAPQNKKSNYFRILAGVGGSQSIPDIANAFKNGDEPTKNAALNALSGWSDGNAINTLYKIAADKDNAKYLNVALGGFIRSIAKGNLAPAQQLLLLRNAMDIAQASDQKQMIVRNVGKVKTFPALVFAGNYLDDASLQQVAAHAVMDIALSDKSFYGSVVKNLLNKTMSVLKGGDSEYEKEAIRKFISEMPEGDGFVSIFNGKDLTGWKGLVGNPISRSKMSESILSKAQEKADTIMRNGWYAKDGVLHFTGKGDNICTDKKYGDFEMFVDWKITPEGDAGIYLRGTPQVQIWDTSRRDAGAEVGSGGLYNNQKNQSKPLVLADNAIGDWNSFHIIMKGERVTVYLNGQLVVDNVIMENYWDKSLPIFMKEQIELQAHGTHVAYRDIYVRDIASAKPFELSAEEKKDGFKVLFDGTDMHQWTGNTQSYVVEDGNIVIRPEKGSGGNLYTKEEYSDFIYRFEFMLTPGANNGLGIRAPLQGDAAYVGMELQILDNDADEYKNLQKYQYHGSVYGVIPAKRGFLKPVGEWNYEEVIAKGNKITITLNGQVILDGDIAEASANGTMDHNEHPGLKNKTGHIGFLGHGSVVKFRNIRVKDLSK
ncbi:MAG: family 16 glycoside hydrolase [Ginsengibacter sp.]